MRQPLLAALLSLWLFPVTSLAQQWGYTYRTFDEPSSEQTEMRGLNEFAEIVGEGYTDFRAAPFLLQSSGYTAVDPFPDNPEASQDFQLWGVNKKRQMVGNFAWAVGVFHESQTGKTVYLEHPQHGQALAFGLIAFGNTDVLVAGELWNGERPVAYAHKIISKEWIIVAPKGSAGARAYGVSGHNGIRLSGVYWTENEDFYYGFRYDHKKKKITKIAPPGAIWTFAHGMNDLGHVTGFYAAEDGYRGFLWDGSQYYPVNVPGASTTAPNDVNNSGQVVGTFYTSDGNGGSVAKGFLATPNPKPKSGSSAGQ